MTTLSGVGVCVTPGGGVGREADYFRGPFEVRARWGYRGSANLLWERRRPGIPAWTIRLFGCRFCQLLSCWPGGKSESEAEDCPAAPAVSTPLSCTSSVQFSLRCPVFARESVRALVAELRPDVKEEDANEDESER